MRTIFTTRSSLDLSLAIKVNGVLRKVKFTSSAIYGSKCESLFSADAELAEAMKKHPMFGVYYYVKEECMDAAEKAKAKAEATKSIEEELRDPATAVYDESVTTKGMAVAYIQGHYDDVFTTSTVEEMKREAARKWNVYFKNWGK